MKAALAHLFDTVVGLGLYVALLQNWWAFVASAGIVIVMLRGGIGWLTQRMRVKKVELAILAAMLYWLANYAWSTGSLVNLLSIPFLRNDGSILVTYPAFFFLLGWRLRPSAVKLFWRGFLLILTVIAVFGVYVILGLPYSYYFDWGQVGGYEPTMGAQRMLYGYFESHSTSGGVYALAVTIALALVLEEKGKLKDNLFLWGLLLSCIVGLAFTFSRSGYLAFVASAAFLFPIRKVTKMVKLALLVVVPTVMILVMSSSLLERVDTISDPRYGTNAARLDIWEEALDDFALSPLVGIGFGRFQDQLLQFDGIKHFVYVAKEGEIINDKQHAHNSLLHFMAEGGIAGLLVMLAIWWYAWKELSFFESKLPNSKLHALLKAAKGTIVCLFAMSMTEHYMGRGSVVLSVMALVGMTLAAARAEWLETVRVKAREPRSAALPRKAVLPGDLVRAH